MHKPDYKIDTMMKAVQVNVEPDVYDDVVVWDNGGIVVATGFLLKKSDNGYTVLNYYDEPQVFIWDHAVKIGGDDAE